MHSVPSRSNPELDYLPMLLRPRVPVGSKPGPKYMQMLLPVRTNPLRQQVRKYAMRVEPAMEPSYMPVRLQRSSVQRHLLPVGRHM